MALSFPKLALPDVEETIAYRCIDGILRSDPVLKRVVRDYNSWTGEASDVFAPTPATCPNLQIAPRPAGSRWETEGMHSCPFAIAITCAVNGSNVDQLMNLWGHVRRALWPSDPDRMLAIQAKVAAAHIIKPTLTMQGFGVQLQKDGAGPDRAGNASDSATHTNTLMGKE